VVDCANVPQANSRTTIRAKQDLTMGDCIPRVLIIGFFPFSYSRRFAHLGAAPEPSGVARKASSFRKTDCSGSKHPLSTVPSIQICAYFLSQELPVLKQNPVENFGPPEAINSMHASTKNGFQ